jgi:hypothetical protein
LAEIWTEINDQFSFLMFSYCLTPALLKFGMVGVSGIITGRLRTHLAVQKLKWNRYLANSIGFSTAVINNFRSIATGPSATAPCTIRQGNSQLCRDCLDWDGLNNLIVYFFHKKAG